MDQATLSDLASRAITLGIAVAIAVVVIHLLEVLVKRLTAKMELRVATIFINLVRGTVWVIALLSVLEPVFNIRPRPSSPPSASRASRSRLACRTRSPTSSVAWPS